ncbi:MAG: reactive intermediate/imine deaminase, partial [Planctomycetes bacterium]|nr:reactive intermediate/imine deaminase [Planctomycetota bacterium]
KSGQLVLGGVAAETRQALENLCHVVGAAGGRLDQIVKTTVYLRDLGTFAEMNRIYAEYFPKDPPARATIGVSALPAGAAVEIEAIAHLDAAAERARSER